jgi:GNAT superfamily N-acetyltransferase
MKPCKTALSIIPGRLEYRAATRDDYRALSRHHYRDRPPATFCEIRGAWHVCGKRRTAKLVGVAVLSWPVPMLGARRQHFSFPPGYGEALRFANANLRTISRVIVHPQYRAIGIGAELVRQLIANCRTRYVETSATMGDFASCFTAAGMTRIGTTIHPSTDSRKTEPAYFVFDRHASPSEETP